MNIRKTLCRLRCGNRDKPWWQEEALSTKFAKRFDEHTITGCSFCARVERFIFPSSCFVFPSRSKFLHTSVVFVKDSLTTSYAFSTEKPSLSSNTWKRNRKYGLFDPITSQPHDMWTTESCSPVFIQLKISFGANQSPAKLDVMASVSVSEKLRTNPSLPQPNINPNLLLFDCNCFRGGVGAHQSCSNPPPLHEKAWIQKIPLTASRKFSRKFVWEGSTKWVQFRHLE